MQNDQQQYHHNIQHNQHWLPHTSPNIRPSSHDDRVVWKGGSIGDGRNARYIQDQNQKNLGGIQSILYQDKLMTTLWHPSLTTTHRQPSQISIAFMNSSVCKSYESSYCFTYKCLAFKVSNLISWIQEMFFIAHAGFLHHKVSVVSKSKTKKVASIIIVLKQYGWMYCVWNCCVFFQLNTK